VNIAIQAALTIRMVLYLPLRQTEWFVSSGSRVAQADRESSGPRVCRQCL